MAHHQLGRRAAEPHPARQCRRHRQRARRHPAGRGSTRTRHRYPPEHARSLPDARQRARIRSVLPGPWRTCRSRGLPTRSGTGAGRVRAARRRGAVGRRRGAVGRRRAACRQLERRPDGAVLPRAPGSRRPCSCSCSCSCSCERCGRGRRQAQRPADEPLPAAVIPGANERPAAGPSHGRQRRLELPGGHSQRR